MIVNCLLIRSNSLNFQATLPSFPVHLILGRPDYLGDNYDVLRDRCFACPLLAGAGAAVPALIPAVLSRVLVGAVQNGLKAVLGR